MLQEIKNLIFSKHSPQDKIWFFFSLFDKDWNLLTSNWLIITDKNLEDLINLLYNWIIKNYEAKTKHIIIDFIKELTPQSNKDTFLLMDPKIYWVILTEIEWNKTWVMLPNTSGVSNMLNVISYIKDKYKLQWDASISTFTVEEVFLDIKSKS